METLTEFLKEIEKNRTYTYEPVNYTGKRNLKTFKVNGNLIKKFRL